MFGSIGPWELIIILTIALVIFGKRLPEVGRSLGKGIVEFKRGLKGIENDMDSAGSIEKPPIEGKLGVAEEKEDTTSPV